MRPRTDRKTSQRMAGIRQRDTEAELIVRSILHRAGLRFRTNARDLPGSPDIVNRKRRWAVFVHGCFWHSHPRCPRATVPKRNCEFWLDKLRRNRLRDRRRLRELLRLGYRAVVVWECEAEERAQKVENRLLAVLASGARPDR